jgi:tetratricopeptide (TPR) repeat protein
VAHINLNILYGRMANVQKAEKHYRAVLALNPDQFPKAHHDHSVLLTQHGRDQEAVEIIRRAIHAHPFYAEAHNNLGVLLQRQGRMSEALEEFNRALERRLDYRLAHFNLGQIWVTQGNYQGGIEEFAKALCPADEKTPSCLYALGVTYGRAGGHQKAWRCLQQSREEALAHGQTSFVSDIDQGLRAFKARHERQSPAGTHSKDARYCAHCEGRCWQKVLNSRLASSRSPRLT